MVHVHADGVLSGRVRVAAELADRFKTHLIGIAAWSPTTVFLPDDLTTDPPPTHPVMQV
jgi:hypothetical protein